MSGHHPAVSMATKATRRILLNSRNARSAAALVNETSSLGAASSTSSPCTRKFSSITPPPSSSSTTTSTIGSFPPDIDNYVSPYAEFFTNIKKGVTPILHSTDESYQPQDIPKLKCGVPENSLRFRTTSYGRLLEEPFVKPTEHKVSLKVNLDDIPFESELEKEIFLQIVGSRYFEKRGEVMLSSDQFASRIENKRHTVSMLNRLVFSSRRLAEEIREEQGVEQA